MTLAAYDAGGGLLGWQHFTTQFAEGAILGSLSLAGTRYVRFNYTNTQFGFYGIDDLSFEPADGDVPAPGVLPLLVAGMLALGAVRRRNQR